MSFLIRRYNNETLKQSKVQKHLKKLKKQLKTNGWWDRQSSIYDEYLNKINDFAFSNRQLNIWRFSLELEFQSM